MTGSLSAQKKRPPPIAIPMPYAMRPVIPGPNAFAIAEQKAKEAEERRRVGIDEAQQRPHTSGQEVPASSNAADVSSSLPHLQSSTLGHSGKEKISQFVEQVRKSPRKSGHSHSSSSAASRHGSTTRSRRSERSLTSVASKTKHLENLLEETTARGELEAQNERKFFKMMGEVPETPKTGVPEVPDSFVKVNDLRSVCTRHEASLPVNRETVSKSPKKKLFGISVPFTKSSIPSEAVPPMPRKVAKVLGANPPRRYPPLSYATRKFSPIAPRKGVPKSSTSKSLPVKTLSYSPRQNRRRSPIHESPSRARPSHRSPTATGAVFSHAKTLAALTRADEADVPPTPPRKDSLPLIKADAEAENTTAPSRTVSQLLEAPTPERESVDIQDRGMKLFVPLGSAAEPIPRQRGSSPIKYCPAVVADQAELVQGRPLLSAHGEVSYANDGYGNNPVTPHSAPLEVEESITFTTSSHGQRRVAGLSLPPPTPTPLTARLKNSMFDAGLSSPSSVYSPQPAYLPATVYSPPPPNTAVRARALGNWPSEIDNSGLQPWHRGHHPDTSQSKTRPGTSQSSKFASAPKAASRSPERNDHGFMTLKERLMEELSQKPSPPVQLPANGTLQPEHSTSQLTDMLSAVSPSKVDFHELPPNGSSAVPSPLHRTSHAVPPPSQVHPMFARTTVPPPLRSGLPMHEHFFMTNEHIDVVAMSLYDWVQSCSHQQMAVVSSKHEKLSAAVDQRFDDLKAQIESIVEKNNQHEQQGHDICAQLATLRDVIKADIVEPLSAQVQKTAALEQGMKELQKTVLELQKSNTQSLLPPAYNPNGQTAYSQRSQPSFVNFYDNNAMQQHALGASDSRRYGANGTLSRHGHGRDSRENGNGYPFANANPYNSPGGTYTNTFAGGFQHPGGLSSEEQQGYGFTGMPK